LKSIKTDRAVIRVGSAPSNDIQLQSPKIAAVHLQILHPVDTDSCCKVVNLAHEIIARISGEIRKISTCAAVDVRDGDEILLDDYSITFRLPLAATVIQSAKKIQAALTFSEAVLRPQSATAGILTIKNAGEHSGCQFRVNLKGLPEDCFQIDPIPLMYAGAQEEVGVRLFHRTLYPPAGLETIVLKVSAPESYPGEELIIRQGIHILPVFKQTLELCDDLSTAAKAQKQPADLTLTGQSAPVSQSSSAEAPEPGEPQKDSEKRAVPLEASISIPPEQAKAPDPIEEEPMQTGPRVDVPGRRVVRAPQDNEEPALEQKEARTVPPRSVPDVSKLKVLRDRSDSDHFWNEG
jgi:hypothetical protein